MPEVFVELTSNSLLWVAIISWATAQLIKVIVEFRKHKSIKMAFLVSSGGMPSSHTSFVTALTTGVGIKEGFDSSLFAIAAILSLIVMYDAAGVRRAAGKQAEVINTLLANLENTGITLDKKLKELLGHSPIEVAAGALLGILIAVLIL